MSLGQCQPLFQELLLLLQPLSVLPFDLNLLLEPRLLENRQVCLGEGGASPPSPCPAHLLTSWPVLQAGKKLDGSQQTKVSFQRVLYQEECPSSQRCMNKDRKGVPTSRSPSVAPVPEWWPTEPDFIDGVVEGEDCLQNNPGTWSQISMHEERRDNKCNETPNAPAFVQAGDPCQGWLRWAKLFGAGDAFLRTEAVSQSHSDAQNRR